MQDKQEILKSFLTLLDKTVSKEEYLAFSKTLMDFVVKIKEQNGKDFETMKEQINSAIETLKEDNGSDISQVKKMCTEMMDKMMDKMMTEHEKKMKAISDKMDSITQPENGMDADEEKVMEMVLAKIPPVKELQPETGEIIVDKINDLPIEEDDKKIDIEHIKGLLKRLETVEINASKVVYTGGGNGGYFQRNYSGTITPITSTDAVVVNAHEATGLIPQVSNSTYGTADSIDMTSMPVGTFYFKHEA
jgi:hypothetical protein